jgi:hypothetical protein
MDEDGITGDPLGAPAIADMDGDGNAEIAFLGRNANLYIIDAVTGAGKSITETGGGDEAVCLFDINGDGKLEAIAQADGIVYAVDSAGNKLWQFQMAGGEAHVAPNAFDIDRDGEVDILCGDGGGNFYCISSTGTEKWRFETGDKFHHQQAVIADFNNDGDYEIAVHSNDRYLYLLSFYGGEYWRFPVGQAYWEVNEDAGQHEGGLAAADLDGDGDLEIITTDIIGNVHCVDGSGAEVWHYKCPEEIWTGLVICDFTGDGELDVIVCAEGPEEGLYPWGMVAVLSKDGKLQATAPWWYTASTPSVGDFDKDGVIEGVFQAWGDPITVLTAGGAYNANLVPWGYKFKTASNNAVWSLNEGILVMSAMCLLSFVLYKKRR